MACSVRSKVNPIFGEEGRSNNDELEEDDDDSDTGIMTSCGREPGTQTAANIGHIADEEEDDRPLLPMNLSFTHPVYCRSLSFSRSNEASASDIAVLGVASAAAHSYPTSPLDSTGSISTPAELVRLRQWLHANKLQHLYQRLLASGFDSVDLLAEADSDDIRQIGYDLKLRTAEKLKLRKAVRDLRQSKEANAAAAMSLPMPMDNAAIMERARSSFSRSPSVIITERQTQCLTQLDAILKRNEDNLRRMHHSMAALKRERAHTEHRINEEFGAIFRMLHERKNHLLGELDTLYAQQHGACQETVCQLKQRIAGTKNTQQQMCDLLLCQLGLDLARDISEITEAEGKMVKATRQCVRIDDDDHDVDAIDPKIKFAIDPRIVEHLSVLGSVVICNDSNQHMRRQQHRRSVSEQTHAHHRHQLPRVHRRCESDMQIQSSDDKWLECGANLVMQRTKISSVLSVSDHSLALHKGCGFAQNIVRYGRHFWRLKTLQSFRAAQTMSRPLVIGFVSGKYQWSASSKTKTSWFHQSNVRSVAFTSDAKLWCNGKLLAQHTLKPIDHRDFINIYLDLQSQGGNVYVQHCAYNPQKYEYDVDAVIKLQIPSDAICNKHGYRLACFLGQKGQSITIDKYAANEPFPEWK